LEWPLALNWKAASLIILRACTIFNIERIRQLFQSPNLIVIQRTFSLIHSNNLLLETVNNTNWISWSQRDWRLSVLNWRHGWGLGKNNGSILFHYFLILFFFYWLNMHFFQHVLHSHYMQMLLLFLQFLKFHLESDFLTEFKFFQFDLFFQFFLFNLLNEFLPLLLNL